MKEKKETEQTENKESKVAPATEKKIKLNLGCGFRRPGSPDGIQIINIDSRAEVKPDMVLDIAKGLPFDDNSADEVLANDFLEHLMPSDVIFVMEEIYRVLKNGGKFESLTPSSDGRGGAMDPMHRSFWNANSWLYYTDPDYRGLYGIKAHYKGTVNTFYTNKQLNIIHDHAIMYAIKE